MPLSFDRGLTEYVDYPVHLERLHWLWNQVDAARPPGGRVRVLDIGCGSGNITIPLGTVADSAVLGIDIHQPTLNLAQARSHLPNVAFELRALEDCDLSGYDVLIMTEVLEHMGAYPAVLAYLADHMQAGARLLVTIPNGRGPFEISQTPIYLLRRWGLNGLVSRVKKLLGKKEPYSQNYETPHVNFFTLSRLRRELQALGLSIRAIHNSFVTLPIIETYLPFYRMHPALVRWDRLLAQHLPAGLASGWYLDIRRSGDA